VPPPPCRPAGQLPAGELERLYRFASIPDGFARWKERDCFPQRLDDATLARTVRPMDIVVSVGGKDAFVIDPGNNWLDECANVGIPVTGMRELTGSDLLTVIDHVASDPVLSSSDIREIGVAVGKKAGDSGPVYALVLGTPRSVVRVQCFEDTAVLVERAAAAMRQAQPVAAK